MQNEGNNDEAVMDISSKDNTYLEEQEDGSYLLHYNTFSIEVPAEDVEAGLYGYYPVKEFEEKENFLVKLLKNLQEIIINKLF